MFIKSLTIKNFRCFGKDGIDINLNDEFTAFVGKNGSGKTTALEALNYLIGQDYLSMKINEKDFHCEANDIKDEIFIEGETKELFFITINTPSDRNQFETIIIPCNKIRLIIKRREITQKVLDNPFKIDKIVLPIIGKIDQNIYNEDEGKRQATEISKMKDGYIIYFKLKDGSQRSAKVINYQLFYNLNRLTKCPKAYYLTKNRDNDVSGNYSFISKILTDLHWKYTNKEFKNDQTLISKHYNALSASLRNIIDEKGALIEKINFKINEISSENKNFQIDFIDIEQPYKSAFISKNKNSKILLPDNLGSGFNILIAYALFVYVAEQEKIPIVLIIDEPELHLHSDWQKKMYDIFAKQTNLQIIYSTHSPYFINSDLIENVIRFENKKNEEVEIFQLQNNDFETQNLFNLENREIFFAKNIILVEGILDRFRFRKFLQKENKDFFVINGLERLNTAKKACEDLKINFLVIVDLDYLGKFNGYLPDLTCEELEKLDELKILNFQIEKIEDEKTKKVLKKFRNKIQKNNKICLSSKIFLKTKNDKNYKKIINKKIEELKEQNIFVLRYGMIEDYLDRNGEIIGDKKEEKIKELKNIFEIK